MTRREKRLKKMMNSSDAVQIDRFSAVLRDFDYYFVRAKGSHFIFKNYDGRQIVLPVHNRRVKKVYIKRILKIITDEGL